MDISRQLACMKLGSRVKYQPIQYCWVHISRLLGYLVSYMPFAYRYPTNLLQHADRTAFTLAALMLSAHCNYYMQHSVSWQYIHTYTSACVHTQCTSVHITHTSNSPYICINIVLYTLHCCFVKIQLSILFSM